MTGKGSCLHEVGPAVLASSVCRLHYTGRLQAKRALIDRAVPAALPAIPVTRKTSQPNYITDLGLRIYAEAAEFLRLHVDLNPELRDSTMLEFGSAVAEIAAAWKSGELTERELSAYLDATVSLAGDWTHANEIVRATCTGDRMPDSYLLCTYAGAICAATDQPARLDTPESSPARLLLRAVEAASSPVDKCFGLLRVAAWKLKRKKRRDECLHHLEQIRSLAGDAWRNRRVSSADRDLIHAVCDNLQAFAEFLSGDVDAAVATINRALRLVRNDEWVAVEHDAALRYRTQIRTNVAQLRWKTGDRPGVQPRWTVPGARAQPPRCCSGQCTTRSGSMRRSVPENCTPALEVRDVSRVFSRGERAVEAVRAVSLQIDSGRTTVVLGPNGAGKTTLVRMCATLLTPTSGRIAVAGVDAVQNPRSARKHVGLVLGGDRGFYLRATADENLSYFASLMQVPVRRRRMVIDQVLAEVGLTERRRDKVETYSRGMRQRLHLARGLLADPPLILMDEPTIGLDPEAALALRELVARLNHSSRSILLTTHYLHEAQALADEVVVIMSGEVVVRGAVRDVADAAGVGDVTTLQVHSAPAELIARIGEIAGVLDVQCDEIVGQRSLTIAWAAGPSKPQDVLETCRDAMPTAVVTRPATLEEAYLALVGRRRETVP
ncbi:MAG: ABC transporter ATP-binding protein [Pseudonocardiaceae bacterium]